MDADARARFVDTLRHSLLQRTGRDLADGLDLTYGLEDAVRRAPYVLVAHDTADDPVFVYGNDSALALFELDWDSFTSLPSRLSAEPVEQHERERLLSRVGERGFVDDYRGVRVSATGRHFLIDDAVVWDVHDEHGARLGQAALFDRWTWLDARERAGAHSADRVARHDLGWTDADLTRAGADEAALAALVAGAAEIPHHEFATTVPSSEAHDGAWAQVYDSGETVPGEHRHARVTTLGEETSADAGLRVVEDRITVVEDSASGLRSRERVRTFLTFGPRGTSSDLAVGYDVDAPPEVRPLSRDELDVVLDWARQEGWNPGLADAAALWAADEEGLWGVEVDGVLVGSGAMLARGERHGIIGLLLVDPAHRREGIGTLTFPFLVDGALSRLAPGASLSLDCPATHQDFCERFGFQPVRTASRAVAVAQARRRGRFASQLRTLRQLPFDKVVDYDARHVGGERPGFVRAWMTPAGGAGLGVYEAGELIGMAVLRPAATGYRIGPLFADEPDIAEELIVALSSTVVGEQLMIDVALDNREAVLLAGRHGFTETATAVHMHLGEVPQAPRENVYAETSLEYG